MTVIPYNPNPLHLSFESVPPVQKPKGKPDELVESSSDTTINSERQIKRPRIAPADPASSSSTSLPPELSFLQTFFPFFSFSMLTDTASYKSSRETTFCPESFHITTPNLITEDFFASDDPFSTFAINCVMYAMKKGCISDLRTAHDLPNEAARRYLLSIKNIGSCTGKSYSVITASDKKMRGDRRCLFTIAERNQQLAFQIIERLIGRVRKKITGSDGKDTAVVVAINKEMEALSIRLIENLAYLRFMDEITLDFQNPTSTKVLSDTLQDTNVDLIEVGLYAEEAGAHSMTLLLAPECALFDINLNRIDRYPDRQSLLQDAQKYFADKKTGAGGSRCFRYLVWHTFRRVQLAPTAKPHFPKVEVLN